jgi:hypothetical protein
MSAPRPTLDYSRLPTPRGSRFWSRRIKLGVAATALGLVFAGGTTFGAAARQQVPLLLGPSVAVRSVQATHAADSNRVIYAEGPLADEFTAPTFTDLAEGRVRHDRAARDAYQLLTGEPVGSSDFGAAALLAELFTADGVRRMISVRYLPGGRGMSGLAGFLIETFDASGIMGESRRVFQAFAADIESLGGGERDITIYGGRVDPNDPSHFMIDYVADGVRGVLDGYLHDDGRTVSVELRHDGLRRLVETSRDTIPAAYRAPAIPEALRRLP